MKVEIVAANTGISLFAENEKEKRELKKLRENVMKGRHQIVSELRNGDFNYQFLVCSQEY